MDIKKITSSLATLYIILVLICVKSVNAKTITVSSAMTQPGEMISSSITVDVPESIAGTVFTLSYNSDYFTLTDVQSTFFDTFTNQWLSLNPVPAPTPPGQVIVDGITHTRPLLFNNSTNSTLIAAARVKAGASETTLFTLQFSVDTAVPDGIYPVSISATTLNNAVAGYPPEGSTLPILFGMIEGEQDLSLAFPALSTTVINGTITVNTAPIDSDGDGIADAWEIQHFGTLATADSNSDWDKDGYTDLQEYLNDLARETDSAGSAYDPKIINAPGGTGYNPKSSNSTFWNLMLPAILEGNRAVP